MHPGRRVSIDLLIAGLLLAIPSFAIAQPLPSSWSNQDVGTTGAAGSTSYSSGTFTVRGSGADIWDTADAFQFVYQPLSGDGQIIARVLSMQDTDTFAKAGVMFRETLTPGSRHVILDTRPGGAIEFMTRQTTGGTTDFLASATQQATLFKLVRSGSSVVAFVSDDGGTWQQVGTTTFEANAVIYAGLVVTSHVAGTLNTSTFDSVAVSGAACGSGALPGPWVVDQDVGATGLAGCASYSAGVFTVAGAGSDIWGTADAFHFMSQPVGGNAEIVAHVTALQNTNTYAKAGIMWRDTLDAGSADVILDVRPDGTVEFMTRSATGAETTFIASGSQPPPAAWLKLTRIGSLIIGAISSDGTTWTAIGTASPTMSASANVGVAVTSHDTSALNTASLDNVAVTLAAPPPTATIVGALRSYSTIYSVGVEWDITGDTNHNASAQTEYRPAGQETWSLALPLVRVDFNGANMLAGSVMFLQPNTSYDVRLTITDPDGGGATETVTLSTLRVPAQPTSGRTFHAVPGSGGGDGSPGNPFQGIAAAQSVVVPGDTVLLHAGSYGGRTRFDHTGDATNYIVWKAAGDGEVSISGIDVAASHIWLERLTVRNQTYGLLTDSSPGDVVVERCAFFGNHYSIFLNGAGANWYIADNTIVGDTPYSTESTDGTTASASSRRPARRGTSSATRSSATRKRPSSSGRRIGS